MNGPVGTCRPGEDIFEGHKVDEESRLEYMKNPYM